MKNAVEKMRICTYGEDGERAFYCVLTWFIFIVFFFWSGRRVRGVRGGRRNRSRFRLCIMEWSSVY